MIFFNFIEEYMDEGYDYWYPLSLENKSIITLYTSSQIKGGKILLNLLQQNEYELEGILEYPPYV